MQHLEESSSQRQKVSGWLPGTGGMGVGRRPSWFLSPLAAIISEGPRATYTTHSGGWTVRTSPGQVWGHCPVSGCPLLWLTLTGLTLSPSASLRWRHSTCEVCSSYQHLGKSLSPAPSLRLHTQGPLGRQGPSLGHSTSPHSTAPWAPSSNANVPKRPGALGPLDFTVATHLDLLTPSRLPASLPALLPASPLPTQTSWPHLNLWPPWPSDRPHTQSWCRLTLLTCSCQGKAPNCACHLQSNLGLTVCSVIQGLGHLVPVHTAKLAFYCFPSEVLHTGQMVSSWTYAHVPFLFKTCGKLHIT